MLGIQYQNRILNRYLTRILEYIEIKGMNAKKKVKLGLILKASGLNSKIFAPLNRKVC